MMKLLIIKIATDQMTPEDELAAQIIDLVSDSIEKQHPELKLKTKEAKECGITEPAVLVGNVYHDTEIEISEWIKEHWKKKLKEYKRRNK